MAIALNDYLFTPVAGVMTPWVNVWVRLVSNNTSTAYISDAATDSKGRFTFATKPPGDTYTVYTGPTNVGAWTSTGDVAYAVPVVQGENPSFQSETTQSIGPYGPNLPGATSIPTPGGVTAGKLWDFGGMHWNVKSFNAKGDVQTIADAAIAGGSPTILTSVSGKFVAADVGKTINVTGAGATGVDLFTTIASYQSATQVTLALAASSFGTFTAYWGTDDTAAIRLAIQTCQLPGAAGPATGPVGGGGIVFFPAGNYLITSTITMNQAVCLMGAGRASTTISVAGAGFTTNTVLGKAVVFAINMDLVGNLSTVAATIDRGGWVANLYFNNLNDVPQTNATAQTDLIMFQSGSPMVWQNLMTRNLWSFFYGPGSYIDDFHHFDHMHYRPRPNGYTIHVGRLGDGHVFSGIQAETTSNNINLYLDSVHGASIISPTALTIYLFQCEAVTIDNIHKEGAFQVTFDSCRGCSVRDSVIFESNSNRPTIAYTWTTGANARGNPNVLDNCQFIQQGVLPTLGTGTSTGVTATTLTDTGQTGWTTNSLVGAYVYSLGSYAIITSNTTTVLTFSGGWVGAQPASGNPYVVPPYRADIRLHSLSALQIRNCFRRFEYNTADSTRSEVTGLVVEDENLALVTTFNQRSHRLSYLSMWEQGGTLRYNIDMEQPPAAASNITSTTAGGPASPPWQLATATYFYAIDYLWNAARLIGVQDNTEQSIALTKGGNQMLMTMNTGLPQGIMYRVWRGTATGVYTAYVDIPVLGCLHFTDDGERLNGYPWITTGLPTRCGNTNRFSYTESTGQPLEMSGLAIFPISPFVGVNGDRIWFVPAPAAGNLAGFCTAAGTPGTWTSLTIP